MPDSPADKGNPNFFRTFKGKFALVPSDTQTVDTDAVMLSCTNDVQSIGDWTLVDYVAGAPFATLPEACRPGKEVRLPVVVDDVMDVLTVQTNGEMSLLHDHATGVLYLSGVNFNISDCWY